MANKPWKTLGFLFPWKTLKLQHTPEKLCSEADFPRINFWFCSVVAFFVPVTQRKRIYEVIGGKTAYHLSCGGSLIPTTDTNFQVKYRMKGGWYRQKIYTWESYFSSKTKSKMPWKTLEIWQKIPWKTLEKNFISLLATLLAFRNAHLNFKYLLCCRTECGLWNKSK